MKKLLLVIAALASLVFSYGQDKKGKVIPPSPQTAEFTKYINYNVSAYNGLPEISIPLYNIELKGVSIPINLSYHASGIKLGQTNGEVGVGWSLNPGYRISRSVYGRPDELFSKPTSASVTDSLNYYQGDAFRTDKFVSKFQFEFGDDYSPKPYNDEKADGEYDIFNFSLPTESGSFVINDRTNKTVQIIERSNIQFNYDLGLIGNINGITRFRVKDESGIKYSFGATASGGAGVFETSNLQYGGYLATAWALRDLETPTGDKVSFSYTLGSTGGYRHDLRTFTFTTAVLCNPMAAGLIHDDDVGINTAYTTFFNQEISTDKEIVKFYRRTGTNLLDTIKVYDYDNVKIKSIRFYYSDNSLHTFLDSVVIRDRNDKAVEVYRFDYYFRNIAWDGLTADEWGYYLEGDYRLVYHDQFKTDKLSYQYNDTSTGHPVDVAVGQYLTQRIRRDVVLYTPNYFSLKKITYPTGGSTEYTYESNQYMGIGNQNHQGGGLRIKEIHSKDLVNDKTLTKKYTYGVNENGNGIPQLQMNYTMFARKILSFVHDPAMSEIAHANPRVTVLYGTSPSGDIDAGGFIGSYVVYPEVNEYMMGGSDIQETHHGKIKYYYAILNTYNAAGISRGPRVGGECLTDETADYTTLYVTNYAYWNRPLLYEKQYFEYKNNAFNKIRKEEFSYMPSNQFSLTGFKVKPYATSPEFEPVTGALNRYYSFIPSFYEFGTYTITGGKWQMTGKKATLYSGVDSIINTIEYAYNDKGYLASEQASTSKDLVITEYTYPSDLSDPASTSDLNKSVLLLKEYNMLGTVLEKRTYRKKVNEPAKWLVNSSFTRYKKDQLVPAQILTTENASLTNTFVPVSVNSANVVLDPTYKSDKNFDSYDLTGNILETHKENDLFESYIWSYKGQYPVARISNARQNQVAYTSFEADGKGNWSYSAVGQEDATAPTGEKVLSLTGTITSNTLPSGNYIVTYWGKGGSILANGVSGTAIATTNGWTLYKHLLNSTTGVTISGSGLIDELRLYPSGAQMNTYTYEPLVGMSSEMNVEGRATYYEYDAYNRLKVIRDKDRNIQKVMDYQYVELPSLTGTIYYSSSYSDYFTRNNCASGLVTAPVIYTVPTGKYTAGTQAAADALAQADLTANGQAYANAYGVCVSAFYNVSMHQGFTRNNCGTNSVGSYVIYSVPANTYSSQISQADANAQAQADINANGQTYANTHGTCQTTYFNVYKGQTFVRNNCGSGFIGDTLIYEVNAGKYSSTISQVDADAKADNEITTSGQTYANANLECLSTTINFKIETESAWLGGRIYQVDFYRPNGTVYSIYPDAFGANVQNFSMPAGFYYKALIYINSADSDYTGSVYFSNSSLTCKVLENGPSSGAVVQFTELNLKGYSGANIGFTISTSPCN
ncbi:DUF5977 domain-containing protein [Chitinophaga niabensis]|uniref:YD repeat-containing protein n=1 Tax=Chitinophaga niabensis TaxID=536979 RepID=A0A1N6EKV9_9BACT|nr:DUF5977 domain-containing protein [Chitinophaga niabensis]SIN83620.1 YD repeat-containing protein [Chitinophaga niabensis]